ncbi:anhydro-N-acetylmuramic acid kinase [Alloacidobacterium sp.]|uniref:anhydro-N-acetylmuramic acid kinase n=1 Tax=Alloacidobacterium sp. TaxID=2951999 RepID=UPI002D6776AA|nr:anhydro-N-acetylmuramic acid kinase [Alloacidobacterium sp.]HYK36462.1 anhydro-N-acetylmuramic acid kinase [Alloacidobacterium sp.]
MTVAGVMSGTSADGIDVALVEIRPDHGQLKLELLGHSAFPFPSVLRSAVLSAMDAKSISTAELARLNWRLGQAYAEAVRATLKRFPVTLQLIGCHGQTIYHQGTPMMYAGRKIACTWQIGEPALLAAELGIPVVSNFRPADMVAGGQGAPLVPLLDYVQFGDEKRARVLQNIGGIGNLTLITPGANIDKLLAFDTGPGNMVIDALMQQLFQKSYDRDGKVASQGHVLGRVLSGALTHQFFRAKPPKSAGREEFGASFAEKFLVECRKEGGRDEDAIATATALTVESIARSFDEFVKPKLRRGVAVDYIVSGGGAKNKALMDMLGQRLEPVGCKLMQSGDAGIPVDAKEAVAFALLAYYTWHRHPANVPSATGAKRPAILGQITYA